MNSTAEHLLFTSRDEFRSWLDKNCLTSGGVWLLFGKSVGSKTITANEALEEALCFGWIDGQTQRIDDKQYNWMVESVIFILYRYKVIAG